MTPSCQYSATRRAVLYRRSSAAGRIKDPGHHLVLFNRLAQGKAELQHAAVFTLHVAAGVRHIEVDLRLGGHLHLAFDKAELNQNVTYATLGERQTFWC